MNNKEGFLQARRQASECRRSHHWDPVEVRRRFYLRNSVADLTCGKENVQHRRVTIRIKGRTKVLASPSELQCLGEPLVDHRNRRRPSFSKLAISQATQRSYFVGSSGRVTFSLVRPTTSGVRSSGRNQQAYPFKPGRTGLESVE